MKNIMLNFLFYMHCSMVLNTSQFHSTYPVQETASQYFTVNIYRNNSMGSS